MGGKADFFKNFFILLFFFCVCGVAGEGRDVSLVEKNGMVIFSHHI